MQLRFTALGSHELKAAEQEAFQGNKLVFISAQDAAEISSLVTWLVGLINLILTSNQSVKIPGPTAMDMGS